MYPNPDKGHRKGQQPTAARVAAAWVYPVPVFVIANAVYMSLSWFPNHRYLEWAEERPQCREHLPDLLLDLHDMGTHATMITHVADAAPGIVMVFTALCCMATKNLLVWNRFFLTQAFVITMNLIAEQSTTIPSSYGYARCKNYLGISKPEEDHFAFSPTGSCVAMIWSGHVFHTMLGSYMLGLVVEAQWPRFRRRLCKSCSTAPLLKTVIVTTLALGEMSLLVLDKGHYTVDMFLAILIALLTFTNSNIEYWIFHVNPFISGLVPERSVPMRNGDMKELLRLAQNKPPFVSSEEETEYTSSEDESSSPPSTPDQLHLVE